MFKVNNRNTKARCEIHSKLTIKTPERRHWLPSGVFINNFIHISYLVHCIFIVKFGQVDRDWEAANVN